MHRIANQTARVMTAATVQAQALYLVCHPGASIEEVVSPGFPVIRHCTVCPQSPWTRTPPELGLWLDPIPPGSYAQALAGLEAKDVERFLISASSNEYHVDLVFHNARALIARGLYEEALISAWSSTRTNNRRWPLEVLRTMFERGDPGLLRAAGEPLPGPGPYTLYRGVAGVGPARRVRGLSWTASRERAQWFAHRYDWLADPTVYQVTVPESDVLAYVDTREENEFVVLLPATARPKRVAVV